MIGGQWNILHDSNFMQISKWNLEAGARGEQVELKDSWETAGQQAGRSFSNPVTEEETEVRRAKSPCPRSPLGPGPKAPVSEQEPFCLPGAPDESW